MLLYHQLLKVLLLSLTVICILEGILSIVVKSLICLGTFTCMVCSPVGAMAGKDISARFFFFFGTSFLKDYPARKIHK